MNNNLRLILDTPFTNKTIVSYGLIVFAKDTRRWIIVQRKHTIEFLLIIQGNYRISYLPLLMLNITQNEANLLKTCLNGDRSDFDQLYIEELNLNQDIEYGYLRFIENKSLLLKLIDNIVFKDNNLPWTWPKGRLDYYNSNHIMETPFECAKREFNEEVDTELPNASFISDQCLSEELITINNRSIKSKYWLYIVDHQFNLNLNIKYNDEVSGRRWATVEQCHEYFTNSKLVSKVLDIINLIT